MTVPPIIPFDGWLNYCFNVTEAGAPGAGYETERDRVEGLPARAALTYLTQMLNGLPEQVASRGADQTARALWFVFGPAAAYCPAIFDLEGAQDAQLAWVDSLRRAYANVFDAVCCRNGTDPNGRYYDSGNGIDEAVYMLWDISELADRARLSVAPHLAEPLWNLLDTVLASRTSTCVMSGLHALGHIARDAAPEIQQRVSEAIGRALAGRDRPSWISDYAELARSARVP